MLTIFRRIRKNLLVENRLYKYLLYAFGEIVLVVIGILIALQINNWNEKRLVLAQECLMLEGLIEDLRSDSATYTRMIGNFAVIDSFHYDLNAIMFQNGDPEALTDLNLIRRGSTFNPMVSRQKGDFFDQISDPEIKEHIRSYFDQVDITQSTHEQFIVLILDRLRPYLADQGIYDLPGWFQNRELPRERIFPEMLDRERFLENMPDEKFQQLLFESNLKVMETSHNLRETCELNGELIIQLEEWLDARQSAHD